MKKSIILVLLINLLFVVQVEAKNVKVEAMSDFSTANPPDVLELKILNGFTTKSGKVVSDNTIVKGNVINVKDPKRLKGNATFSFEITDYKDPVTNSTLKIDKKIIGKYSSLTDVTPKGVIKTGAIAAGNKIVGAYLGPSVALVEGAVKNEQGNVVKSAAVSVYESTPLSYVEKGHELEFKAGDIFVMSFKVKDSNDDDPESESEYESEQEEPEESSDIETDDNN